MGRIKEAIKKILDKEKEKMQVLVAQRKVEQYLKEGWSKVDIKVAKLDKKLKDNLTKNQDLVLMER